MDYKSFGIDDAQASLIEKHLSLVLDANTNINLTRIDNIESAHILHIEDSLIGLKECLDAPDGEYADIGSGAGYPGIPLAIATGRFTTLVESVKKKADCLRSFSSALQIDSHVSVFAGRTEEIALQKPNSFSLITARALSSLPSLLELASPLLTTDGWLVAYKSGDCNQELSDSLAIQSKVGLELYSDRVLCLSDGQTQRRIFVFIKVSDPTVSLPRRPGMAQNRPYRA